MWGIDHLPTTTTYRAAVGADNAGLVRRANVVGVARTRAFEVGTTGTATLTGKHPRSTQFQHYLFDVRMLCKLTLASGDEFSSTNFLHNGARIKVQVLVLQELFILHHKIKNIQHKLLLLVVIIQ